MDIHDVVVIVGIPPHALQQLGARKHPTGVLSEREQQGKLTRGQFDRLPMQRYLMLCLINRQVVPVLRCRGLIRRF